ncbi:MAG: hypothetical protein IIT46_03365 [Lachnospiraceae bacterium]|nr:hypothetical protein [Lachnospiraceae bacterium]
MEFEEEFEFAYQEHFRDVFTYSIDPSRHSLEYEDINFESDYIKYYSIGIFGIPHGLSEEEEDNIFSDPEKAVRIGTIEGYLILGEEIERRGYNLYDMCDEINADLEYVISALCESGGVMQAHNITRPLNIFYIHEVEFENEEFRDMMLTDILIELPDIMFSHTNILPEMMIYYPRPLPYDTRLMDIQKAIASETVSQVLALNAKLEAIQEDPTIDSDYDNEEPHLALSQDQINMVMGKRVEGDSYPESAKDLPLWGYYELAGFSEWKNTRVLYNFDLRKED